MTRGLRIAGVYIAFVAMLVRALLPTGWMPNPAGFAGTPLIICTAEGGIHLFIGLDGKPVKQAPADNGSQHDECPFAAAPHFAAPVSVAILTAPVTVIIRPYSALNQSRAPDERFHAPQSSRGPPQLA